MSKTIEGPSDPTETREHPSSGMAQGCMFAIASTVVTCALLFINGGLVAAICEAMLTSRVAFIQTAGVQQFCLFLGPVVLVVIQWMMIDYVINRLRRWS